MARIALAAWLIPVLIGQSARAELSPGVKGSSVRRSKEGREPFPLRIYNARTGKSEQVTHAKVVPGMNRITFEKGEFHVWYNGSIELTIGLGAQE